MALNNTLDQMELINIFRVFHHTAAEYTFFSSTHETFSKIDHMWRYKSRLNKIKKIEITSNVFSNHNGMKVEINYKKKTEKHTNTWRLCNMLLNNEWVNNEIKEEI